MLPKTFFLKEKDYQDFERLLSTFCRYPHLIGLAPVADGENGYPVEAVLDAVKGALSGLEYVTVVHLAEVALRSSEGFGFTDGWSQFGIFKEKGNTPPEKLYFGCKDATVPSVLRSGIIKVNPNSLLPLFTTPQAAYNRALTYYKPGKPASSPVVLEVSSLSAFDDGSSIFHLVAPGEYLTEGVALKFVSQTPVQQEPT